MMTGIVSQAALAGWSELLPRRGVDVRKLCEDLRIDLSNTQPDTGLIALSDFVAFLEQAGGHLKRPDFFWRAGEVYDLAMLGPVGDAILASKTLGGALKKFATYFSLLQDSSEMTFVVDDQHATISYRILDPTIWPRSSDAEFTLGIVAKLIRRVVGQSWRHTDVVFEVDTPFWGHAISDYLETNCAYGGATNSIKIPVSWLSRPIQAPVPNSAVDSVLNSKLIEQRQQTTTKDRTRYHIFKTIGVSDVDQTAIAKEMGMSRRTLRRRLERESLNFQTLVDTCRMEVATLELKRRPTASLAEVAFLLGYTEHSSFTRAFSRWSGLSPQNYRKSTLEFGDGAQFLCAAE